jgi:hypothetical protein
MCAARQGANVRCTTTGQEEAMSTRTLDLAPEARPRPGLALVLALLAIPGSTVAWDLPAGGLWIGLPLAVAAIVLGRRAQGTMAVAAIVIASLCIAQMAVWTVLSIVS